MWIDGVSVTLSSGAATTTSGGGYFSFLDVEGGTYTITISGFPGDASFDATTAEVTIAQADQSVTANFSGAWIRTASLMGMVTVEGTGLPGITVSISGRQDAQMLTDDNGQYTFTGLRAGNYTVEISGFDATDVAFSATSSAVMVSAGESKVWSFEGTFVRESAISGQVAVEGNGLAGVTVSLQGMGADEEAMTDAGGQYTFSNLRAGEYQLAISGYDTDEYGFSTTSATVRVEHGRTANVPFEGILLRTASIMGQVSVEGEGLAEVTVSLSGEGENQTTMTDNSGQYAFTELPAGNFQVGISGYDTSDYSFETTSKNVAVALGGTATVPFDGILLRTSGIAGRVSVDGMGLGDVTVTLTGGDLDDAVTAMTDATGQYAIAGLAAGDYTVAISGYNAVEYAFTDSQDVTLAKDATAIVNFTGRNLRTAAVSVMVTADGVGVPGVAATLIHVTNLVTQSGDVIAVGATGADGSHMFSDLLAGTYAVQISGTDEEIDFATTTLVAPVLTDQTAELTFPGAINRTASIGGSVTIDGAGMADVMVSLSGGDDNVSTSMATGGDGSYSFTGLRRGDYTVSITNPDDAMYNFASTSSDVSLGVGQAQGDVSFAGTQVRTSSISGQVNVEGDALGGVTVMLAGAMEAEQTTGDDGLYAFRNLGSGSYTVSIANPDDAAYNFESMSMDFDLGNSDNRTHNFSGMHTRDGSISGMLYVDEGTKNDSYDEGEHALMAAGVEVALVGPTLLSRTTAMTDSMGAFAFDDLRQGSYQVMPAAPGAAVMDDFMYGGAASNAVELGVAEDATQNLPYDITHQTVNFSVNLKSGETMGDALPGATVSLFSDLAGAQKIGDAMSDADGMASIRFARSGGNTVYASVAAPAGDYHTSGMMQAVTWDAKYRMTDASNNADIVNTMANFSFSGMTITTDFGGGKALGGWAISVSSDKSAAEGAPEALGADGSASYSEVVMADSLPVTYTVAVAGNQDNALDGGESYKGTELEHMHDGLSLPATMDAGTMEVHYTSQTLKVYVHHERDQVMGYTGNVLGGDARMSGVVEVGIRYIERSSGRSRAFNPNTEWNGAQGRKTDSNGVVTFRRVPAGHQVIVTANLNADAGNVRLLRPDELDAYTDNADNGRMGGAFGDEGGYHHTVELCPLMRTDPSGQRFGECGSFAYVSTYLVHGQVWKEAYYPATSGDGWTRYNLLHVPGTTVTLTPVEGENLAGDGESYTAATRNWPPGGLDERKQFSWGQKAAGVYTVTVPDGWVANVGAPHNAVALGNSLNPLAGELQLDVTPSTGFVYGRVTDDDGFAVEGVSVHVNGVTVTTDGFGRYYAEGFPSQTRRISGTWYSNKIFVETNHAGHDATNSREDVDFAANTPMEYNFSIAGSTKTATIAGTITAAGTGEPVAGASIWVDYGDGEGPVAPLNAASSGANRGRLVSGSDGSYSATVRAQPAGTTVAMSATKSDRSFTPAKIDVSAIEGSAISGISFTGFLKATITGRVTVDGGPMQGATVVANQVGGTATDTAVTGVTGTYSLFVPFGNYDVEAMKDGYDFSVSQRVNVGPGESKSIEDFTATETPRTPSSDATLSGLSLSAGMLEPAFASDTDTYTAEVDNNVASVTVTGTASDANASVAITLAGDMADTDQSNGRTVDLDVGDTEITAMVVSEDESDTTSYVVTVTRVEAVVTLSAPASIDEGGTAEITASVDHGQAEEFTVTVSATGGTIPADANTLTFAAGATDASGSVTVTADQVDGRNPAGTVVTVSGSTDAAGVAAIDDVEMAVIDDELVATAPRNLMATPGDQTATVTWTGPSSIGSMPITSYDWELTAPARAPQTGSVTDLANLTVTLSNLDNGVSYTFSVHGVSSLGDGETATTTVKAQPNLLLTPATATVAEAGTDSAEVVVTLSNSTIEDVTVTLAADSSHLVAFVNATMVIEAGTTADTTQVYGVQNLIDADNQTTAVTATADNANDATDTLTVTITDDDDVSEAPRNLTVTAGDTKLTLEWISPANSGTSPVMHYQYRYSTDGTFDDETWTTVDGGAAARSVDIEDLVNDTAVTVEVRAVTAAGNGAPATGSGTPTG